MRCIPCEENAARQNKVQAAFRQARAYAIDKGLSKILIVEDLKAPETTFTYCEPGDPKLYSDYNLVETILI